MQTKATIMSKSPLLSLEWATKPDRLVRGRHTIKCLKSQLHSYLKIHCVCVCQLLLGSGVGTVRLYDTDAKKNLYEMNIDETHPR